MDLTTAVIASVCFIVGLAVGSLLTHRLSPQEKKRRELAEQLRCKEDELKTYQRDVSEHFIKTSELLNGLIQSHREVSEHMATSALVLTSPDVSGRVQKAVFSGLSAESRPRILSSIVSAEAPKDYAPSVPGGVLSESYGLSSRQDDLASLRGLREQASPPANADNHEEDDPTLKIG